jgi:hypothetical protein
MQLYSHQVIWCNEVLRRTFLDQAVELIEQAVLRSGHHVGEINWTFHGKLLNSAFCAEENKEKI